MGPNLQHTYKYMLVSTRTFGIYSFSSIYSLDFFPVHWYWPLNLNMISWSGKNGANPGGTTFSCNYWTNLNVLLFLAARGSSSSHKRGWAIFGDSDGTERTIAISSMLLKSLWLAPVLNPNSNKWVFRIALLQSQGLSSSTYHRRGVYSWQSAGKWCKTRPHPLSLLSRAKSLR